MTWENFTYEEFECKCGCGLNEMDEGFIDNLQLLRTELGFPLVVTSGYRCPDHPAERAKSAPGPHQLGVAVDLAVTHKYALLTLYKAMELDLFTGFGLDQKGDVAERFIHLDNCEEAPNRPRPHIFTYP